MNWKKNYIIKSIISRPVIFSLAVLLSSMITYSIMDNYQERIYEKQIKEQQNNIFTLNQQILRLETEIIKMSTVIEEEFDETTGKLIKKKISKSTEKEKSSKDSNQTIQESIISKVKEQLEKETLKRKSPHQVFLGYGATINGEQLKQAGYMYSFGFLNVGFMMQIGNNWDNFGGAGLIGVQF